VAGPAARFVVTPQYLYVDTALWRTAVPRHLMERLTWQDRHRVRLHLRYGGPVTFRLDPPVSNRREGFGSADVEDQERILRGIWTMLCEVPAADTGAEQVTRTVRWCPAILTGTAAVASLVALLAMVGTMN
jgi:hypothetical protein